MSNRSSRNHAATLKQSRNPTFKTQPRRMSSLTRRIARHAGQYEKRGVYRVVETGDAATPTKLLRVGSTYARRRPAVKVRKPVQVKS